MGQGASLNAKYEHENVMDATAQAKSASRNESLEKAKGIDANECKNVKEEKSVRSVRSNRVPQSSAAMPQTNVQESQAHTVNHHDDDNDSVSSEISGRLSVNSLQNRGSVRRYSLAEVLLSKKHGGPGDFADSERVVWNPSSNQITVGDVVRVSFFDDGPPEEGIVVEKVNQYKLKIDFGEHVRECLLENCALLIRGDEFEVGDKVEARPKGSSLYFVGKVIKVHEDKSVDVLMDGDDPDDIEYNIPAEDARKLMSRRSVVVNRWRKAFMLVVAANLFQRITFQPRDQK